MGIKTSCCSSSSQGDISMVKRPNKKTVAAKRSIESGSDRSSCISSSQDRMRGSTFNMSTLSSDGNRQEPSLSKEELKLKTKVRFWERDYEKW